MRREGLLFFHEILSQLFLRQGRLLEAEEGLRIGVLGDDVEQIARAEHGVSVGDEVFPFSEELRGSRPRREGQVFYRPAVEGAACGNGELRDASRPVCGGSARLSGHAEAEKLAVDRPSAEEAAHRVGRGGGHGEGQEVLEIAGQLEEEHRARDGGADGSGEKGRHGEDDHICHGLLREKPRRDQKASRRRAGERAHGEGGEEEPARRAASEREEGEECFPEEEERQDGKGRGGEGEHIDESFAAAGERRAEEGEKARRGEGQGETGKGVLPERAGKEPVRMEDAVIERKRRRAAHRREEEHIGQMVRREGADAREMEDRGISEKETDQRRR